MYLYPSIIEYDSGIAMKRLLYFLLFTTVLLVAHAQDNCFFTHYSSEDGLSQNTVMSILQDQKGNIWFATWDGINKFNGYNFKSYKASQGSHISLTNNRVDYMYEDKYGYLWMQTYDNSVHRFNPRTETFEQVPASGEGASLKITHIKILSNGTVWLLTEREGAIRVTINPKNHQLTSEMYSVKSGNFPADKYYDVREDRLGNEWILTGNGLGMIQAGKSNLESFFVGKQEGTFKSDQSFRAFSENDSEIFFGSNRGRIWRYQKNEDGRFLLLELPTRSNIVSIQCINENILFAATANDGFFVYDLIAKKTTHYSASTHKELQDIRISSTYKDRNSEIWFEQEDISGCILHFNPFTSVLKREQMKVEPASADRSRPAFHIHEDIHGRVWVHPFGGGMSYFDKNTNSLVPFYNEPRSKDWKFSNKIHSAFSDRQGNLWMCTHSKGLEKVTFRPVQFHLTTPNLNEYESLSNDVRALMEDNEGNVWAGFKNGLLRIYDKNRAYKGYLTESGQISTTGNPLKGVTYFLLQDSKGVIWIATKGDGLIRAEKNNPNSSSYSLTRYKYDVDNIYSLSNDNVYCVYEDKKGRIWIATFAGGLNYMDTNEEGKTIFINHRNNLKGYPIDNCYKVRHITSDNKGNIWVGTTTGAISFNGNFAKPEEIVFKHHARIPGDPNSLSNNDVHWIINTTQGELFLATFGGGLNKLLNIDENGNFKSYSVADGLPSDVLLSIREDKDRNLWISTEHGISKFIPAEEQFENYDDRSITFRVRFNEAASAVTTGGYVLFGANSGIFRFKPDSILKSNYVPPITLSRLLIANQEIIPGEGSILKSSLDDAKSISLSHKENIFAIQYAALDYNNPGNIQYAYMLDGFDKQWTYADKLRGANYTNLPKGHYVFKVKSTNSDGVWVDNMRTLNVEILPSFWETSLAYFLYILFILLIIFTAVYILFTIYRLKHEVSVEQQVSDIKLRFFTDVSHELRTPLTLIAGPVENVLKDESLSPDVREQLQVVERNTNRMLRLVNQILDFRKIQNRKMKMLVQKIDIVPFVRKVMENFDSLAEEHNIDYIFETEKDNLYLWLDDDKLEKIVFNLLSNAFKYTPNGKMIAISIREDENTVSIEVRDQGIGIAENRIKSVFIRFENLVDKNLFNQASTGIGLSLVKELVEMHKGRIIVESRLGEGSSFKVEFLKGKEHYSDNVEFILNDTVEGFIETPAIMQSPDIQLSPTSIDNDTVEQSVSTQRVMLLVEDNHELRAFLRRIFVEEYRVIEAVDGMEGWSKALKFVPDIIISDVMMPEKDGIEMMKELRADMTTSHIPIVLLTAKTSIESKLEGLEYGADDYITKPFSATYLKARVDNIISQRSNLQRWYRDNLISVSSPLVEEEKVEEQPLMSPIDRKFMDKLMELMEKNMDNGDLIVDDLVSELAVSRSVFFKKLKTLTGFAPIEFIKEMRISRAAQLIETGEFNMTQISYMVGINDPRYFSKCFKQKYKMTPTEYRDTIFKK